MAFLLDGLHEDLNRITRKPYIEINTEIDKRPDAIIAAESWSNYKKRNDSIIVDTFHGLLKSTLVCPECQLISVTFDPFCYLSLPLPVKRERAINMTFFPAVSSISSSDAPESSQPVEMVKVDKLMIPKIGIVSEICQAVAKVINENKAINNGYTVDPARLIVADVFNHRFQKLYSNDDQYTIGLDEIYVYETVEDRVPIPIYLREVKGPDMKTLFGQPFIVNVEEPVTYDKLYDSVVSHVKKYFKVPSEDGDEEDATEEEATESDTDEGVSGCDDSRDLFSLYLVNSYGNMNHDKLDKTKPLRTVARIYLAADFKSSVCKRYDSDREESLCRQIPLAKTSQGKTIINLNECLNQFTLTEKLGSDDPWYCPRCKKHQEATKKFDLWSLPKVLIIHLKRFSYSRFWRDKLDTMVDYPITGLNMGSFVINPSSKSDDKLYDLCAVANHYGGLGGGHYTAYGKNRETNTWHYFDDSNVTAVPEENVVSKAGYVLFYLRRD